MFYQLVYSHLDWTNEVLRLVRMESKCQGVCLFSNEDVTLLENEIRGIRFDFKLPVWVGLRNWPFLVDVVVLADRD